MRVFLSRIIRLPMAPLWLVIAAAFRILFHLIEPLYLHQKAMTYPIDVGLKHTRNLLDTYPALLAKAGGYNIPGYYHYYLPLDLVFPLIYTLLFLSIASHIKLPYWKKACIAVAVIGMLLDYSENTLIAIFLRAPDNRLALPLTIVSGIKLLTFVTNMAAALVALIFTIVLPAIRIRRLPTTLLLISALSLSLNSCRVLSAGQIKNVHAFAEVTERYCAYPSSAVLKWAAIHRDNDLLDKVHAIDENDIYPAIRTARESYLNNIRLAPGFDTCLMMIRLYAKVLLRLTADDPAKDIEKNAGSLGEKLSGLIGKYNTAAEVHPVPDIGDKIAIAVAGIGYRYVKYRQAKALKQFIPLGDTLIQHICALIRERLGNNYTNARGEQSFGLYQYIQNDSAKFRAAYTARIIHARQNGLTYPDLRLLYQHMDDLDAVEQTRLRCIDAADALARAHAALVINLRSKRKLEDLITEVKNLAEAVQACQDAAN